MVTPRQLSKMIRPHKNWGWKGVRNMHISKTYLDDPAWQEGDPNNWIISCIDRSEDDFTIWLIIDIDNRKVKI